jgi:DNA polymerase III epsilon subunit-like protein
VIFFDTETSGLPKEWASLKDQPHIIELALVRVDMQGQEEVLTTLVKPPLTELDPVITRITGLTLEALRDAPTFPEVFELVRGVFWRELADTEGGMVIAHNAEFDMTMLTVELRRMDMQYRFPYPRTWVDTVPLSGGKKLENWAREVMGERFSKQQHRALDDVRVLMECWKALPVTL